MANAFQTEQDAPELATLAELAENLVYRLPLCPDVVVRKTLRAVCREFCSETRCLTADVPIGLEPGVRVYPVPPVFGGVVAEVRSVRIGPRALVRGRDWRVSDAPFGAAVELSPALVPPPAKEDGGEDAPPPPSMLVRSSEVPRLESERVPPWFVSRHGDALVAGAMARLCSMQGRAWADANAAAEERARYEDFKSEARMRREFPESGRAIDMSEVL